MLVVLRVYDVLSGASFSGACVMSLHSLFDV